MRGALVISQSGFGFIITGRKLSEVRHKEHDLKLLTDFENKNFVHNLEFIDQINSAQDSWEAAVYEEYSEMTLAELMYRAGGLKRFHSPEPRSVIFLRSYSHAGLDYPDLRVILSCQLSGIFSVAPHQFFVNILRSIT